MLHLSILSPERKLFLEVQVNEVTLPSSEGQIQILPGHIAMIGTLETGVIQFLVSESAVLSQKGETPHEKVCGVISTGFFEIKNDRIMVLAETIELQEEINIERALKAQKNAQKVLEQEILDEIQFKKYQLKLQRSIIRQSMVSVKKTK